MRMELRRRLRSIRWLHSLHLFYWTHFVRSRELLRLAFLKRHTLQNRYQVQLERIQGKFGKEKIKVLFLVSNTAKWKCQSVFDIMQNSDNYDPIVGLVPMDIESSMPIESKRQRFSELMGYFKSKGMPCIDAYDFEADKYIPLSNFGPDIVWYQMPDCGSPTISPETISSFALSCYVPYFVQNYGGLDMDCGGIFHRMLWRHFILNEEWARIFMRYQGRFFRVGETIGAGHPMLDRIVSDSKTGVPGDAHVIYAPHWSCGVGENFSTFLKNGEKILNLAKENRSIRWVFKPHPSLRHTLIENKLMSEQEVDRYYSEWGRIGEVCQGGDYSALFAKSSAMITDCASFLTEYGCTGRPVIHLISSNSLYKPHPISARLYDTYYKAHNWDEFIGHFLRVVINGDDYKRDVRLSVLDSMQLRCDNAANNIVTYLDKVFGGKGE